MLESIGVPLGKLKFVRGTDYQLSRYRITRYTFVLEVLITVRACVRGKVIGLAVVVVVNTKIASSGCVGIGPNCRTS